MKYWSLSLFLGLATQTFAQSYWLENIAHQGVAPFNAQGAGYQVFRNVKNFGAVGKSSFRTCSGPANILQVMEYMTIQQLLTPLSTVVLDALLDLQAKDAPPALHHQQ